MIHTVYNILYIIQCCNNKKKCQLYFYISMHKVYYVNILNAMLLSFSFHSSSINLCVFFLGFHLSQRERKSFHKQIKAQHIKDSDHINVLNIWVGERRCHSFVKQPTDSWLIPILYINYIYLCFSFDAKVKSVCVSYFFFFLRLVFVWLTLRLNDMCKKKSS